MKEKYCVCSRPWDGRSLMLECHTCKQWFHGRCMSIEAKQVKSGVFFICPSCSSTKEAALLSRAELQALDRARAAEPAEQDGADPQETFCFCSQPDDGREMVECNGCSDWFHVECVGEAPDGDASNTVFVCDNCTEGDGNLYVTAQQYAKLYDTKGVPQRQLDVPPRPLTPGPLPLKKRGRKGGVRGADARHEDVDGDTDMRDAGDQGGAKRKRVSPSSAAARWEHARTYVYLDAMVSAGTVPWSVRTSPTQALFAGPADGGNVDLYDLDAAMRARGSAAPVCAATVRSAQIQTGLCGAASLEWSADGTSIAAGSWGQDGAVSVIDVEAQREVGIGEGHSQWVRSVRYAHHTPWLLASASNDRTVRLWDTRVLKPVAGLEGGNGSGATTIPGYACGVGHIGKVAGALFLADANSMLSVGSDQQLRLWDLRFLQKAKVRMTDRSLDSTVRIKAGRIFTSLDYSPSKRLIALNCESNEVVLMQEQSLLSSSSGTGAQLAPHRVLYGHKNSTWGSGRAYFSPSGDAIAAGSEDGSVSVWDSDSGALLRRLAVHASAVWDLSFASSHADTIVTAADDTAFAVSGVVKESPRGAENREPEEKEGEAEAGAADTESGPNEPGAFAAGQGVLVRWGDGKYYHGRVEEVVSRTASACRDVGPPDECCLVRFKGYGGANAFQYAGLTLLHADCGLNSCRAGCPSGHTLAEVVEASSRSGKSDASRQAREDATKPRPWLSALQQLRNRGLSDGYGRPVARPSLMDLNRLAASNRTPLKAEDGDAPMADGPTAPTNGDSSDHNSERSQRSSQDGYTTIDQLRKKALLMEEVRWVQCDRRSCGKWRRLPGFVDPDELPALWFCEMNRWSPNESSCSAPEDDEAARRRNRRRDKKTDKATARRQLAAANVVPPAAPVGAVKNEQSTPEAKRPSDGGGAQRPVGTPKRGAASRSNTTPRGARTNGGAARHPESEDDSEVDGDGWDGEGGKWVQCENCKKWRRLPSHVPDEALPEKWLCKDNDWDPEHNSCSAPQEPTDSADEDDADADGDRSGEEVAQLQAERAAARGSRGPKASRRVVRKGKSAVSAAPDGTGGPAPRVPASPLARRKKEAQANGDARPEKPREREQPPRAVKTEEKAAALTPPPRSVTTGAAEKDGGEQEPDEEDVWVQCDRRTCRKWRRLPKDVDVDELPPLWFCTMNRWDPRRQSCNAPEDLAAKLRSSAADEDEDTEPPRWITCVKCGKSRRVPSHLTLDGDAEKEWCCFYNEWDPDHAVCEAPQEVMKEDEDDDEDDDEGEEEDEEEDKDDKAGGGDGKDGDANEDVNEAKEALAAAED